MSRPCPVCQGQGLTDRVHYEVELDGEGNQVPVERHTIEPCGMCHGSGTAE